VSEVMQHDADDGKGIGGWHSFESLEVQALFHHWHHIIQG
jgi:hypothetical protein